MVIILKKNNFKFINYCDIQIPIGKYKVLDNKSGLSKSLKVRSKFKFTKIIKIAENLIPITKKLEDILKSKNNFEKDHAFAILIMIHTGIRIGNDDSAKGYICKVKNHELFEKEIKTYGLSTLLKDHIHFDSSSSFTMNFVGKKGIKQNIKVQSQFLTDWAKYFHNINKGERWLSINIKQLSSFIKKNIGKYHIKDFRTLKACLEAGLIAKTISNKPKPKTKKIFTSEIKEICESVSKDLGNTPGICRKSYINPEIFEWLALERFPQWLEPKAKRKKVIKK